MDFIYKRYRQETQSALKAQPAGEKKPLSHYEVTEQKRKENNQPEEKMLLQNSYGAVNLGRFRGEQAVLVVSGISEHAQKKTRETDLLRETGAKKLRGLQGRAFTNHQDPLVSAMGLKVFPVHTAEKLVKDLQTLEERGESHVLKEMLPFLSVKEERERILSLLETRRAQRERDPELERELDELRINRQHKEQERRRLVKSLRESLEREEKQKEKKKGWEIPAFSEKEEENVNTEGEESEDTQKNTEDV